MQFVLNNSVDAPLIVDASVVNGEFQVVLTAGMTSKLATGSYTWAEVFSAVSDPTEKARGYDGLIEVLPNLTAQSTPTTAQAMVTLLKKVIAQFAATTKLTVNFNGQQFTRASVAEYQKQLVYWESRVIADQRRVNALRGNDKGGEIRTTFARPRGYFGILPIWPR